MGSSPIEAAGTVPDPKLEAFADRTHLGRQKRGFALSDVPRILLDAGEDFIIIADVDGASNRSGESKAAEDFDKRTELGLMVAAEEKGFKMGGSGHEPDGHAGDDAEVGLRKETIEKRADPPTIERTGDRSGETAVASFDNIAGW